eukprot:TRINITY_DN21705_c0_g1_i1.p1 TRINITY_DN21705_c0_g1~~TRINITY_DN21705_c0_g1_i1.p1  ORF type:complete len:307 (+),score=73.88 TRINITY_DN21705_c0_g1_i1:987-1907(+)
MNCKPKKTVTGTPLWMSPEVLAGEKYNSKADIWSLGITAIELAEGAAPRATENMMQAMMKICTEDPPKLKAPEKWSKEFSDWLAICLDKDVDKRPSSSELIKHPWLAQITDPQAITKDFLKKMGKYKEGGIEASIIEENAKRQQKNDEPAKGRDEITLSGPVAVNRKEHSESVEITKLKEELTYMKQQLAIVKDKNSKLQKRHAKLKKNQNKLRHEIKVLNGEEMSKKAEEAKATIRQHDWKKTSGNLKQSAGAITGSTLEGLSVDGLLAKLKELDAKARDIAYDNAEKASVIQKLVVKVREQGTK